MRACVPIAALLLIILGPAHAQTACPDGRTFTGACVKAELGEGMRKQVSDALASLALLDASAFDGAGTRRCTIEPPNVDFYFDMSGDEFLLRWSLPNFYFHLVIAYAILRKEGLAIGKLDYLGSIEEFRRSKA